MNDRDYTSASQSTIESMESISTMFPTSKVTAEVTAEVPELSDTQEKVLSLLFVFSGLLSILGSSTIVWKVVRNRSRSSPYDRLMLGLSSFDILASLSLILTPFLLPKESSKRVWAIGSDTSCTILGFMTQLSFAAMFYNGLLSFYYLLIVRFRVKRRDFAIRYEPIMHSFTIVFFFGTALSGAILGVYSELDVGFGCWVNEYPTGCEETGTCISEELGWAFASGPAGFTLVTLIVNNLIIYIYVKKNLSNDPRDGGRGRPSSGKTSLDGSAHSSSSGNSNALPSMRLSVLRREERALRHKAQIREVATQGFLYVGTCLLSYSPYFALKGVEAYAEYPFDETKIYPLLIIVSLFLPLQGFFNLFVYTRPSYHRVRAAYPGAPTLWALRKACLDSDIPKLTEISRYTARRSASKSNPHMHSRNQDNDDDDDDDDNNNGGGYSPYRDSTNYSSRGRSFQSDLDVVQEGSREDASISSFQSDMDMSNDSISRISGSQNDDDDDNDNNNDIEGGCGRGAAAAASHVDKVDNTTGQEDIDETKSSTAGSTYDDDGDEEKEDDDDDDDSELFDEECRQVFVKSARDMKQSLRGNFVQSDPPSVSSDGDSTPRARISMDGSVQTLEPESNAAEKE